jgi:hypothetical protein
MKSGHKNRPISHDLILQHEKQHFEQVFGHGSFV